MCGVFIYSLRDIGSIDPAMRNPTQCVVGMCENACAAERMQQIMVTRDIYIYTNRKTNCLEMRKKKLYTLYIQIYIYCYIYIIYKPNVRIIKKLAKLREQASACNI